MLEFLSNNPVLGILVLLLWISLILYGFSAFWWLFEVFGLSWGWRGSQNTDRWENEDIQVRILTIGAQNVVQATVNSVPDSIIDIQVIAEKEITISGAQVHVVPEDFECEATNKGRAVEWARQNVDCNREYVLYLDEDTLMTSFEGIPDADIVQFTEKPLYTGSKLAYLCEIFRVGYQFEQLGFHRLRYPLYAWGGGVAIRHEIEDEITWDVSTITEDTNFIWRAAESRDLSYRLVDARFRNQAPPSMKSLIKQRRRWISGTIRDGGLLPVGYRPLYYTRIIAWAFSPFVPLLVLFAYLFPGTAPSMELYGTISLSLLTILFVYTFAGIIGYRKHPVLWPILLLLTPVAVLIHSIGALWGLFRPVESFEVTEKLDPGAVEAVHDGLEEGDLTEHDGTERLLREDEDQYQRFLFDDD